MRSRKFKKRKRTALLRSRFELERLDSRLLLNAGSEWLGGIDPASIDLQDAESARLLEDLNDLFHDRGQKDGVPDSFYSDPTSWDLSVIFGADLDVGLDELHQWVDAVFQNDDTLQNNPSLKDTLGLTGANTNDAYVSPEVLAAGGGSVLYLDFNGGHAQGRSNDSWLYNYNAQINAYDLGQYGWAGRESESANYIAEFVREDYAAYNVSVVTSEPTAGAYTTLFVGGNNDWFQANSGVIGVATFDVGNTRASNYGFAFTEELSIYYNSSGGDLVKFSEYVANLVSHEAGHTFGANHIDDTAALMNPYLPLSPRTSMFGSNTIFGASQTQDTQALLGNNVGYAHGQDDFGDIFSSAETITANSLMSGVLERRDDVDVFELTVTNGATLTVDLDTTVYGNLNSVVSVYRGSDSNLIAQNNDDGSGVDSLLTFAATAGETYYITVSSDGSASSGTYQLAVGTNLNWSPEAQIDVSALTPVTAELNQYGDQTISDTLSIFSTDRVYQVVLDVNGAINVDLNDDGFGAYAALYDANGQLLDWDNDSGPQDSATLSVEASVWQDYYLVVGGVENSGVGGYQLTIDSPDVVSSAILLDGSGSGQASGSISVGDSDYFRFTAPSNAAGLLNADLSVSGSFDAVFTLYDSSGQLVSRVDNNGASVDELLAVDAILAGETYFLRIADAGQNVSGDYSLDVRFALPAVEPQIEVTDSLNSPVDHLLDFDRLTVNTTDTAEVTIRNSGLLDLVITELSVGSGFSLDTLNTAQNSSDDLIVAPGQSLSVTVTFLPDQISAVNSQMVIVSNDSEQNVLLVNLTGQAHAPQADMVLTVDDASLTHSTLNLGQVIRGQTLNQNVTITNNGLADLVLSDIEVAAPLSLAGTTPSLILPGESVDLTIEIVADQRGTIDSAIHIASNDPDSPDTEILIQAQVLGGVLSVHETAQTVDDNHVDFGAVPAGTNAEQWVTLTNDGDAALTITTLAATSGFTITPSLSGAVETDDLVLAIGESLTVTVSYSPTVLNDLDGVLTITTDDIESPVSEIDLAGSTLAGVLEIIELDGVDNDAMDLGRQQVHVTNQINVWQINNTGNIPVTLSLLLANDLDFHLSSATQVVVPAGESHVVEVEFNTSQARQVSEQLLLQADDFFQTTANLNLTADGYAIIGQGEKYRFIDQSGDRVVLSLSGEATAQVVTGQANEPDIAAVTLLSGSGNETLSINVKGGGRTRLGELAGEGSLRQINAAKVDLVGEGIDLAGKLQSLRLGNVLAGADIAFNSGSGAEVILENIVGDSDITIQGGLKQFSSQRFSGGRLKADTIETLKINGPLNAQVNVVNGDLDRLLIRGGSLEESVDVQGSIGKVVLRNGDLRGAISAQDSIGKISVKNGSLSSTIRAENRINQITAENIIDANVSVLNGIGKVVVTQDMVDSAIVIGYTALSQNQHGASATLPINAYLASLKVKGAFSSSNVAVGVAPDSDGNFLNGIAATSGGTIGRIALNQVHTNNHADPFGLIARSDILKLTVNQQKITDDYQQDDFHVSILPS